jgi:hypothetical protein
MCFLITDGGHEQEAFLYSWCAAIKVSCELRFIKKWSQWKLFDGRHSEPAVWPVTYGKQIFKKLTFIAT